MTNTQLIEWMHNTVPKSASIYADAAEPQRIQEILVAGFNVRAADKSVKDGIEGVQRFDMNILKGSENLMSEVDSYLWKEHVHGYQLDEPVKKDDHAIDALRYAVYTHWVKQPAQIYGFA